MIRISRGLCMVPGILSCGRPPPGCIDSGVNTYDDERSGNIDGRIQKAKSCRLGLPQVSAATRVQVNRLWPDDSLDRLGGLWGPKSDEGPSTAAK